MNSAEKRLNRLKKVLFVISTLTGGGAERAVSNITLNLPEDVQADILVNSVSNEDYPYKGRLISMGMPPRLHKSLSYHLHAFALRLVWLRHLKKVGGYDACISFLDSANIANVLTGNRHCKVLLSVRIRLSMSNGPEYRYIVAPLVRRLYNRADRVVSLSKGVKNDLVKNFGLNPEKQVTVYNCYNVAGMQQAGREAPEVALSKDGFYFVSTGRHCDQKGQWHLIRAFAQIARKYSNARLILLGQGELTGYLEDLARQLGVADRVDFPGFVKNPFAVLSRCQIFIFPSLFEGFGNSAIEAMACGLPVIVTDYRSGAREIFAPETDLDLQQQEHLERAEYGILIPVFSGQKHSASVPLEKAEVCLAEAMALLYDDADLRAHYREKSLSRAVHFDHSSIIREWVDIF